MDPGAGNAQGVNPEEDLLGEALGFLAKECGWDKDFVAETLTIQQILRYAEVIQQQKMTDLKLQALSTLYAVAAGFGSIKYEQFRKFLDSLDGKKEATDMSLDRAKEMGLVVEEK